ncbi:SIS domain-containing protein [Pendulispora brunnea]|uniref:Phosphoheptose isomerase n=1 Tax=Pendulispora brunnea TaxID=2905690 RepID=A0ABZ2K4U1_9BACT
MPQLALVPDDVIAKAIASRALHEGGRLRRAFFESQAQELLETIRLFAGVLRAGKKVLLFGNGGSAADAQHIAAELVGRFVKDREALPAIALTVDTSALTAIGNDYGFEQVFARQVRALGQEGDLAVAISTSGTSPNVIAAIHAAREKGMRVMGLSGRKGGQMPALCDTCLVVPSNDTARIQELHITIGHILCEVLEASLEAPRGEPKVESRPKVSRSAKEVDLAELMELRRLWRAEGHTVVWTNGNFDVFHIGHLESLRAARKFGTVLVVGVNSDEAIRVAKAAKVHARPVFPVAERVEVLTALEVVDYVLVFDEPTPERILSLVQPDVHCKGADYAPPNGAPIPEAATVAAYGGRVEFLPLIPGRSSTSTLARLLDGS